MKGGNEQDDEEFEMLLGEIPTATSAGNLHSDESGIINSSPNLVAAPLNEQTMGKSLHSNAFTNYYHASQSSKHGATAVSVSPVSVSPVSSGPFPSFYSGLKPKNTFNQKTQNEGNQSPAESVDQEAGGLNLESNLLDDQSLTSALANLSFKSGTNSSPTTESSVLYKGLPHSGFLVEAQFSDHMGKPQSGLEVLGGALPPSPNRMNSVNFVNSTLNPQGMENTCGMRFPSLTNINPMDKFSVEAIREENAKLLKLNIHDIKKHKVDPCLPVDEFVNTFGDQTHNPPMYSGPLQMPTGVHSFSVFPRVPVSGLEFPAAAYQQQYFLDAQGSPFMQPQHYGHPNAPVQHMNNTHVWQHVDEDRRRAIQQQYVYLQQMRNLGTMAHNQLRPTSNGLIGSLSKNCGQSYYEMPLSNVEQPSRTLYWSDNAVPQGFNQSNLMLLGRSHWGESCPFVHGQNQIFRSGLSCPTNNLNLEGYEVLPKEAKHIFPEKFLTRSHAGNSMRNIKPSSVSANTLALSHAHSNGRFISNHCPHHSSVGTAGSFLQAGQNSGGCSPHKSELHAVRSRQHLKYHSLDEVEGKIYTYAKDQNGCRFLQQQCSNGTLEDVQKIFIEVIDHIVELMTDPFGNYLVQKLVDFCNEDQRMEILRAVTENVGVLLNISLNPHGTRALQRVIESLKIPEQIRMIVSCLKDGILILLKDVNGNHVLQRCLQYFDSEYNEFILNTVTARCIEISTHSHGCCVIQKCLRYSEGELRCRLLDEIIANALMLSQDPYGNYVVQYIFELNLLSAARRVIDKLKGHFACLSTQKCSSNVVEKCLKTLGQETCALIIQELVNDSCFGQLLQDPYANYVVQSALANSKGAIHAAFVDAIRPHVPALRSSPFGKRILSFTNLKSKYHSWR